MQDGTRDSEGTTEAAALADAQLVTAIAAGGERGRRAEIALCQRFGKRVQLYGLRHLRDPDRARDLQQGVLLGVLEAARAGRIHEPDKLVRFIMGTCRNTLLRVREQSARSIPDADLDRLAACEPIESIEVEPLLRCVSVLEARAQQIVWLSFRDERSAEQIGAALAMSAGNVRVVRHRALAALRRCLDARAGTAEGADA